MEIWQSFEEWYGIAEPVEALCGVVLFVVYGVFIPNASLTLAHIFSLKTQAGEKIRIPWHPENKNKHKT